MTMTVITESDLLQFLHQIHCATRNGKGIKLTGIPSLNEINNFLALYFIKDDITKYGLPEECSFDYLYENYATDKDILNDNKITMDKSDTRKSTQLWKLVYYANDTEHDCIIKQIINNEHLKPYFASEVSRVSAYTTTAGLKTAETIQKIFNMVYKKFKDVKLDYDFFDALGSAYEKFKTDEIGNSGKNTGQHFTPGCVKQYIIEELKPTYKDTYYEPCSGSGGFIHTAYSYIYKNDKKNANKFKKNIYANEINPEIQKPLMINMLLHNIPVININTDDECDSLSSANCRRYKNKMSKIASNVPFGVKTELKKDDYENDYWKPLLNGKNIVKESTAQFLVHIYHCLTQYGEAGIVVDRGILNNGSDGKSWQSIFRKWFLENVNLYKVVMLPTGIFEYTNFATAILFFQKGYKTESVGIYEGKFKDVKTKKDFYVEDEPIKVMTIDEIKKNNYSLKIDTEEKKIYGDGWVKLGDICEIQFGTRITKANDESNIYDKIKTPVYGGGGITFYTKREPNRKENTLIISRFGVSTNCVRFITESFFLNDSGMSIINRNKNYIFNYIKYFLKINENEIYKYASGNGQKNMETDNLKNKFMIPSLPLDHQQEIVNFLDEQFTLYDINKLSEAIKDIPIFNLLIKKQYDEFADLLHMIYRRIEADLRVKTFEIDKRFVFKTLLNGVKCDDKKLGDIAEICKKYKHLKASDGKDNGKYHFYSCAEKYKFYDDYEFEDEHLIINRGGNANIRLDSKFAISHDDIHVIKIVNQNIRYIYMYIKFNLKLLEINMHGGGIKHLNKDILLNLPIKLPSLEDQQKIISEIEKIEKEQQSYKEYGEKIQTYLNMTYENITKMTMDELLEENTYNNDKSDDKSDDKSNDKSNDKLIEEEKKEVKTKKVKVKKINKKKSEDDIIDDI